MSWFAILSRERESYASPRTAGIQKRWRDENQLNIKVSQRANFQMTSCVPLILTGWLWLKEDHYVLQLRNVWVILKRQENRDHMICNLDLIKYMNLHTHTHYVCKVEKIESNLLIWKLVLHFSCINNSINTVAIKMACMHLSSNFIKGNYSKFLYLKWSNFWLFMNKLLNNLFAIPEDKILSG